ncbi:DUF4920 domain-containing protein [Flavivirga jejuensis]|uniref:DUF4920 domain-containing protein n=1 Tax=Flavivirga jejuensis TaxID=870487 RepID=A0ABT8WTH0_9FLAO|nr:DUF4920 domain-containing protein [Flavivirga jejuensis]MDO5976457.1 DUF4920 domain-containing protein [Flavivirga jejuensis]
MKSITLAIICVLVLNSCKNKNDEQSKIIPENEDIAYKSFGKGIIADGAIAATSMASHYKTMNLGDSINSKIIAKVNSVCQVKGCWMTLNLEDGNDVMVTFKDYGFFMPKDITGKEVVVNGKAFIKEIPIDELIHYAKDAGKPVEEIAAITEPKKTYSFVADGVLLKE